MLTFLREKDMKAEMIEMEWTVDEADLDGLRVEFTYEGVKYCGWIVDCDKYGCLDVKVEKNEKDYKYICMRGTDVFKEGSKIPLLVHEDDELPEDEKEPEYPKCYYVIPEGTTVIMFNHRKDDNGGYLEHTLDHEETYEESDLKNKGVATDYYVFSFDDPIHGYDILVDLKYVERKEYEVR